MKTKIEELEERVEILGKTIYDLELHEEMELVTEDFIYKIIRVPGGWIYRQTGQELLIFVPFHGEFDPKYYSK